MNDAPLEQSPKSWIEALRGDLLPSVVVFLVALPLCMGIAIASGAPVAAGLVTGIVGGLVVGALAGSPLQVSGPAAGLTVIIVNVVQEHGLETLGLVVLMAGALQAAAGLLRLGQWFRAVSPAVIQGMLAGIGVLILTSQLHVMVDDAPRKSGVANITSIPEAIAKGLPMPKLGTREEREFRSEHLKSLGTLHDNQVRVQEMVGEVVPETDLEHQAHLDPDALEPLIAEQAAVLDRLKELAAEVVSYTQAGTDDKRSSELQAAAAFAIAKSEEALRDLESHDVARVRASQKEAEQAVVALLGRLKNHDWAAKIGLLTIAIILLWQGLAPKKLKLVPAPLLAVVIATTLSASLALPVLYVEVPDNLMSDLHMPSWTVFREGQLGVLLQAAVVVAVVASAETLLCATAVDQLHHGARTRYDRELAAQGVGNMVCGIFGALPMTGVIVRSAANVQAGATTRASAILHGVWLLLFVSALGFLLRMIPTASLAAILVYTGYKLVNPKAIRDLWQVGVMEVVTYFATLIVIVAFDLLTGVLVGVGISALKLLYTFSHLDAQFAMDPETRKGTLSLDGAATFIRLPVLAAELEKVPRNAELHVDFEHLSYIDHACMELLMTWSRQHEATGGRLVIDWDSLHANFRRGNGKGRSRTRTRNVYSVTVQKAELVGPKIEESPLIASESREVT